MKSRKMIIVGKTLFYKNCFLEGMTLENKFNSQTWEFSNCYMSKGRRDVGQKYFYKNNIRILAKSVTVCIKYCQQ